MINAYDFDKTIYDGDSSINFYLYCFKKNKKMILDIPYQLIGVLAYKCKLIDKTKMKEHIFCFLKRLKDVDKEVDSFWKENKSKIKKWYLDQKENSDVIISASPEFLLKPLEKEFHFHVIASEVDKKTGKFLSKNCHDYEKIKRFEKEYSKKINKFYTDSIKADKAMLEYAKEGYIVNKDTITKYEK